MYGGNGGTPLGGHTPAPCQASLLPPHNPRLQAPPKHGHVRRLSYLLLLTNKVIAQKRVENKKDVAFCFCS